MDAVQILIKLVLATICGGIIGFEREHKRRPAGFRTHILVCLGATLVMMVNEYISNNYSGVDPARLGAQVISGIGFLGAGTIIVTGRKQVKGLTTAAGLWASACMGLAVGAGFYLGAFLTCMFIFFVMTMLSKFDGYLISTSRVVNLYLELGENKDIGAFIAALKSKGVKITEMEINRMKTANGKVSTLLLSLLLQSARDHDEVIAYISSLGVSVLEEI